ncbi:putative AAA family ATPase y4kL [Colletotrichum viniferum]|nr:putative AAA family ATPase y4kL [Colletotrichum viniferum]
MDIEFNSDAFDKMILPLGYKSLILSLIEGMMKSQFDDMIQGKGLGNILLLVGNPGIGKTLTAEALADKLRKPLYVLSAGELGQTASELELKLRMVLELAAKWDAVLLFDECDVFLQEQSTAQLAHNEIVAVFLR